MKRGASVIISIAKTIFVWSFIISLVTLMFNFKANKKANSSSDAKEKTTIAEVVVLMLVVLLTLVTVVGGILVISFKYVSLAWVCLIVSFPLLMSHVTDSYLSVGIIKNIVQSEKKDKLSTRERLAVQAISYALYYLEVLNLPNKLLSFFRVLDNTILSDLAYITFYMLLLFLYTFLTCALLSLPLITLSKFALISNAWFKEKTKLFKIGDFFVKSIDKNNLDTPLLIKTIEKTRPRSLLLTIIVWGLTPIFIFIDVFLNVLKILTSFLLECIGYIFLLFRLVKQSLGKIAIWINNLSDRRMVATSFRLALITTLALTVAVNRYTPLLQEYESSTNILEFVAGGILIPVIFEWITSARNKKEQ